MKDFWPMMDSADPIEGWSAKEVIQKAPLAKNDTYGSLFMYIQDILLEFCYKIASLKIRFQLSQVNALDLPGIIKQYGMGQYYFDRIEVRHLT